MALNRQTKILLIFFVIVFSFWSNVSAEKNIPLPSRGTTETPSGIIFPDSVLIDSTLADSLQLATISDSVDGTDSLNISVIPLPEVEAKVREMEDSFYSIENKAFSTNSYFNRANKFYTLPYSQEKYNLYHLKLNNFYLHNSGLLDLLNYYYLEKKDGERKFYPAETDFLSTLSALQFSNGSYGFEEKYANFHKNEFAHLFDLNFFLHSGKQQTPASEDYFFDDLIIQTHKDFNNFEIDYNFLKQFSNHNNFPPSQFSPLKTNLYTHIFSASLSDSTISISYLNQSATNNLQEADTTISYNNFDFNRNQIALAFHLPIPNYETDVLLRADNNDYEHQGSFTEYYGLFKINSPGFFSNDYTMTIFNELYHKTRPDTTYLDPKMVFQIPVTESIKSQLSLGAKRENISYLSSPGEIDPHSRENIFFEAQFEYLGHNSRIEFTPFIHEIRNDKQYVKQNPNIYEISEKYKTSGVKITAEMDFEYLSIWNKIRCSGNFQKKPDEFVLRPDICGKLWWDLQRSLGYHNIVFAKTGLTVFQNYRNSIFCEEPIQVFSEVEFGFRIKQFVISAQFKNLTDQPYFMSPEIPINGISSSFRVHWNFIN